MSLTRRRSCKRSPNEFCFVCGEFIKVRNKEYRVKESDLMCKAYGAYFQIPVKVNDKYWIPQFSCERCKSTLENKFCF